MVTRLWLTGPPTNLLQPALETDERPEAMAEVGAALLVIVDERLDGRRLEIRARRRRRSEQRVADVLAQLAAEPGVERDAKAGLRPAIDVFRDQIGERVPQDRL